MDETISPEENEINGTQIISLYDSIEERIWFGINAYRNIIIELTTDRSKPPFSEPGKEKKRLVMSELITSEMPIINWELMILLDLEPFVLLVWSDDMLFKLVWNGIFKQRIKLDASRPQIFTTTLFSSEDLKSNYFQSFEKWVLKYPEINSQSIGSFFVIDGYPETAGSHKPKNTDEKMSYTYCELFSNEASKLAHVEWTSPAHERKSIIMKHELPLNV